MQERWKRANRAMERANRAMERILFPLKMANQRIYILRVIAMSFAENL
jgi:hypothetical protein